ncbi:MAG: AI-2E family transporter [Lachnospiraceae bacterium]
MVNIKWKTCFKIGVSAFILFLCIYYWQTAVNYLLVIAGSLISLFIGGVIAYIVNILMTFLESHYFADSNKKYVIKSRRPVCMIVSFLIVLLIVVLVIALVVPELIKSISMIINRLPVAFRNLSENELVTKYLPVISEYISNINWNEIVNRAQRFFTDNFGGMAGNLISTVSTVFSSVLNFVLGLIFSIYLLLSKDRLCAQAKEIMEHYVKKNWNEKIQYVLTILNRNFHRFIVGQCTEAVILGVLCAVGMVIFRFPYAIMIGVLVGFTALIPVVGAYVGAAAGIFMMLTISPMKALMFVIFIVVLQQLEGNLIYPRVVGNSLGLPALWVLVAVTVGGGIGGVIGMLVAVPIVSSIYQLVQNDVRKRRAVKAAEEKKMKTISKK